MVPDGPAKVKIKGVDFNYWSRIGGPAYRFAHPPSENELKALIRKGFEEALQEQACDPSWRPTSVVINGKAQLRRASFGGYELGQEVASRRSPDMPSATSLGSFRCLVDG